jgi:1-acyl-sn-glycerol-3-phosphate acyltransferase
MIRALIVVVFLALYILVPGPLFVLYALLARRADTLYAVGITGAKIALWLGGIRIRAEGRENIPSEVCIFAGNHSSNVDPPAVAIAIGRRIALLGKKEAFRIPVFGRALLLAGFVPVDRSNREAAAASVEVAIRHLHQGISFLVFPEGTRSPDGRLRAFKRGTFVMAIKAGVPVVPVSVVGAHARMPRGSNGICPGEVVVRFHPAIRAENDSIQQRVHLQRRVFDAVAAGLPENQRPLAPPPADEPSKPENESAP